MDYSMQTPLDNIKIYLEDTYSKVYQLYMVSNEYKQYLVEMGE